MGFAVLCSCVLGSCVLGLVLTFFASCGLCWGFDGAFSFCLSDRFLFPFPFRFLACEC